MTTFATVWFWRGERLNKTWHDVARFTSDAHPHPFLLKTPVRPEDDSMVTETYLDDSDHLVVKSHVLYPEAPPLWFVIAHNPQGLVPLTAVSAFADGCYPAGTVVPVSEAVEMGVDGRSAVGALSWVTGTGVMQQVIVAENCRRRKISTILIEVADTLIVSSGADFFMTGGEFTTKDGEGLRQAWAHSPRVIQRRGEMP
jgi:hypothetical protein